MSKDIYAQVSQFISCKRSSDFLVRRDNAKPLYPFRGDERQLSIYKHDIALFSIPDQSKCSSQTVSVFVNMAGLGSDVDTIQSFFQTNIGIAGVVENGSDVGSKELPTLDSISVRRFGITNMTASERIPAFSRVFVLPPSKIPRRNEREGFYPRVVSEETFDKEIGAGLFPLIQTLRNTNKLDFNLKYLRAAFWNGIKKLATLAGPANPADDPADANAAKNEAAALETLAGSAEFKRLYEVIMHAYKQKENWCLGYAVTPATGPGTVFSLFLALK